MTVFLAHPGHLEKEEKKVRARRNSEVMAEMDHERRLAGELVRERQRAQVSSSPPLVQEREARARAAGQEREAVAREWEEANRRRQVAERSAAMALAGLGESKAGRWAATWALLLLFFNVHWHLTLCLQ